MRTFFDQKYNDYKRVLSLDYNGVQLEQEIAKRLHLDVEKVRVGLKQIIINHSIKGAKTKINALPNLPDFQNLMR